MPFDQTPIGVALAQTLERRPLATSLCEATFGRVITSGSASPNLPSASLRCIPALRNLRVFALYNSLSTDLKGLF